MPDNLKSAVSKACRYDPELNPSYAQLAAHYQTAVIPARPYKPKDKSKAEVGVQVVERWIMMRLRKLHLFGLVEANQAIRVLLDDLNNRPFKQRPWSRQSQFESIDKPALKLLPSTAYVYRHVLKARAHIDYHVSYNSHHYSVPYRLRGEEVMVHAGEQVVAVFYQGKCVAEHPRSRQIGGHTTSSFQAFVCVQTYKEYGYWQQQGVDRNIMLSTSKQILIDEKVRHRNAITGKVYEDSLLGCSIVLLCC